MMMETLDQEHQVKIAQILCDMLMCMIHDFKAVSKTGKDDNHEQNQRKPFKAQGIHLYTSVLVSPGSASSGEYETTVPSL
jgi:hypothetical protein